MRSGMLSGTEYYLTKADGSELYRRAWTLCVVSGPDRGVSCPVNSDNIILGAANASALPLVDDTISRYHAEISFSAEGAWLRDLDSTNGTFFDGREITECFLRSGDRFFLGNSELELSSDDEVVHLSTQPTKLDENGRSRFVALSPGFLQMVDLCKKAARSTSSILISGPAGSGKMELARFLHEQSPRADGPFLSLTVPTEPSTEDMMSTLFGIESKSDAQLSSSAGLLERATGGTLFIENFERLPPACRSNLRTCLRSKRLRRTGDNEIRKIDVRLVSSTNSGRLEDLGLNPKSMSHLATVRVTMPPLSARQQEVHELCARWLSPAGQPPVKLGQRFRNHVAETSWERELDSIHGAIKQLRHDPLGQTKLHQARILDALEQTDHNISAVAHLIGASQSALFRYLTRYEIDIAF